MFCPRKLRLNVWALAGLLMTGAAEAQPALTQIQDVLYRADGTRFTGTMFITWSAFQAGDASNIATSNLTLPIVNGVLSVSLAPTTTASAGAQYNVTYNQNGVNQFTQVWAVPPSTVTLHIRDVLVSTAAVVGPVPLVSPVQISDVSGLTNALSLAAQKGVGYALGRTAIINDSGQIDGASGDLSDCMHVDGTAAPCGAILRIDNSGSVLPVEPSLNFVNGGCVDNPGATRTDCTVAGGLAVGSSAISGGTSGQLLYDNGGVLGNTPLPLPPNCTSLGSGVSFTATFAAGVPCNSLSLAASSTIILPASPSFSQAELWITYTGSATTTPITLTWTCSGATCASLPSSPDVTSTGAVSLVELRYNTSLNVWGGHIVSQTNGALSRGQIPCSQGAAGPPDACNSGNTFPGNAATATALAATPSQCGAGMAANGIEANGNAQGCFTPGALGSPITAPFWPFGAVDNGTSTASPALGSANVTQFYQFYMGSPGILLANLSATPYTGTLGHVAFALYDSSCNLLQASTTIAASTNTAANWVFSPVLSLPGGTYYLAVTGDTSTLQFYGPASSFITDQIELNESASTYHVFTGNASTGTTSLTFPGTCGTRTALFVNAGVLSYPALVMH